MKYFDQKNPYHNKNLYDHCMHTFDLFKLKKYSERFDLGAKLHDYGKLYTQTFDENGIAHYFSHGEYGSYYVLTNLIIFSSDILGILESCFLINYHMMPFNWTSDEANKRWKKRFGEYKYKLLLDFNECDRVR